MVIVGEIYEVGNEQQISESFSKTEIVIKTVEQYPNFYVVEFQNNNQNHLDGFMTGENVKIQANLRGRQYKKQDGSPGYIMNLVGWKIERN